ncbi:MAG TPA: Hsp20/alpha crystallin family protein [Flavitalea sp.]|nr:Hsp20/alpha crystallin family protein [Flavitalea sp.]
MTFVKMNNKTGRPFDSLFDDFVTTFPSVWGNLGKEETFALPPVNIYETKEGYELELNVPGRKKEDFQVSFEKGMLTISYDKKAEQNIEGKKPIRKEFSFRSFKRTFHLDDKINVNAIAAKYENGMLTLALPKNEEKNESGIHINIQ